MQTLYLHPGRERRILQGHRWVFSNEISSPLSDYEPGSWVEVYSSKGVLLGSGYINPQSLIAVRLVCRPGRKPTEEFFRELLRKADSVRRELFYPGSECYRMVYGESDGLPGLIVDRYRSVLVYQIATLGMSRLEPLLRDLLVELFQPEALVFRNDSQARALEGLPAERGIAYGEIPPEYWVDVDGVKFNVDFLYGQKTGLFLDQRDNRKALQRFVKDRKILDLFCYQGGWSLSAALGGAKEVTGIDQSAGSIERARSNAVRNGVDGICTFMEDDAFQFLKKVEKGSFDLIVLDPPAFAKTKSALPEAKKGYVDLNRRALLALKPGGILATCSCSYHLTEDLFREVLLQASLASGKGLRILETRGQAPDHPVLLAMPETRYLKCHFAQTL